MHVGWEKRAVARALKQRYTLRRFSRAFWNLEGISFSLVSQENSEHPFFRKSGNLHGSQTHIEPEKCQLPGKCATHEDEDRDNMIFLVFYMFVVLLGEFCSSCSCAQVYVVYMGKGLQGSTENRHDMLRLHHQMLTAVHDGSMEKAEASHVYTYSNGFQGFAAKLNKQQAMKLANMPGVISVFPNTKRSLHTTHSWDFMGLSVDAAAELPELSSKNQENVIIGFIDTGIWPESPSFRDHGMPPVPTRWRGQCQRGEANSPSNFTCNRKIIGGRYYLRGYQTEESGQSRSAIKFISPRDSSGHGSHTASIAAGRFVRNMNYRGLGTGGGRGGAPMARIAAYKTCWDSGCYDADILAAFDDAIADGVDIISVSLGPDYPQGGYFTDAISIGSFHATSNGILVVSSAGNAGRKGSATNLAPWILTVAAGTTDRSFPSYIRLANGTLIMGESLSTYHMHTSVRTISASEANASSFTPYQSSFCLDSSLNRTKARGKILICHRAKGSSDSRVSKSMVVKEAGALGMILIDEMEDHVANHFALPATVVGKATGDKILSYISSTRCGSTMILPAKTILGSRDAPRVAAFSSRGPNSLTPEILKPDIAAPGLNILAAWSPAKEDKHFNILSGTSMACPHVTGIAALVKGAYPSWSPSAIKSAIMTTATVLGNKRNAIATDPNGRTATPFDFGSGFADPIKALNPGIIFDAHPEDYKSFLCSIGYDDHSLHLITQDNSSCTDRAPSSAAALNYPSITIPNLKKSYSVTRTMTNVGFRGSAYHAFVSAPLGINVTVTPKVLVFENYGAKKTFTVNFHVDVPQRDHVFGSLLWHGKDARLMMPLVVKVDTAAKA
ncbi:subtilisin-like serine-protease S [Oryza glaberrima]|uniref:subtilisin-like serine-protease S n=1 Tax=Oryza glaberrima TaxID=4538 RepID=UPI00224C0F29|nr:subtilisin-like serine-protease S [Oryza glaberrima]